jgi:hypothetical protein
MFFWDHILNFGLEVDLVWKSKWNFMKGLYLFQRYLTYMVAFGVILYRQSNVFPIFLCSFFFVGQTGNFLTEAGCRRVSYANGGS